jgi:transcriptional regulator with XRE-family HTH domain
MFFHSIVQGRQLVMINAAQVRAARALLDISQAELSRRADVGVATVKKFENSTDELRVTVQVLLRIQRALESAGIVFIDQDGQLGPGVRLRQLLK